MVQIDAQVVLSGGLINQSSNVQGGITGDLIPINSVGFEVGLGYWNRIKSKRLEFIPEVSYTSLKGDDGIGDLTGLNLNANVLIYALDFHSDCNSCPTFSKDGGTIKKGFHWIIAPGFSSYKLSDVSESIINNFRLAAGAGLDIGITNMLTLVPFVTYSIAGKEKFYGNDENRPKQLHLGLRSIFRFDKNKW